MKIPICLKELEGISRQGEPITIGVPFTQGALNSLDELCLTDSEGDVLQVQFQQLARWPDGSLKWVLTQFSASIPENGEGEYFLQGGGQSEVSTDLTINISIECGGQIIRTPNWRCVLLSKDESGELVDISEFELYNPESDGWWDLAKPTLDGRANGVEFGQGQPETIEILEKGPVRVAVIMRGRFVNTGDWDLRYTTLLHLHPNRSELRMTHIFHFHGGAPRITLEELKLKLNAPAGAQLAWMDKTVPLTPTDEFKLVQKEDLSYAWRAPNDNGGEGKRAEGEFVWQGKDGVAGFGVRDFWEKSPAGITFRGDGQLQFDFLDEPLTLTNGTSFRREMVLALGEDCDEVKNRLIEFTQPLAWSIDPEYFCETRALGHLSPEDASKCPGFENGVREGLAQLLAQRQADVRYFGLLNYGDWPMKEGAYGSTWTIYADNEYDAPHVLFMLFARSGLWEYFQVGRAGGLHMTDVDTHCANGGMFFHGYSGGSEDHKAHRGGPGEWGHAWADGMLDYYFLTGDVTALDAAKMLGDYCLRGFAGEGHEPVRRIFAGCERAVGWPLITLASLAEATGEEKYLQKSRQMVDYLVHFVNNPDAEIEVAPGRGHWWRILMQDGCKPFMVGVLYEGLKRYHQLTKDENCLGVFQQSLDWMIDKMWYPLRGAFEYEFNAFNAGHRDVFPHYINLLVVDGLAYAYRLTGERRYLEVGVQAFHAALWTLPGLLGGKELGMGCRSSLDFMALLSDMQKTEAHAPAGILAMSAAGGYEPTVVEALSWPERPDGEVKRLFCAPFDGKLEPEQSVGQASSLPFRKQDACAIVTSDGLHAVRGSSVTFRAEGNVAAIAGTCKFRFRPDWPGDSKGRPYPRTLIHIQGEPFTRDALSLIVFYNGMHLRAYGPDRKLSGVIETDVTDWRPDDWHNIAFTWGSGRTQLFVDGELKGEVKLRCPFGESFSLLRIGHRPGFWFADGWIREVEIFDGVINP